MSLVERVQSLCSRKNTTLIGLEREIGLGRGTIRNWEKSSPSIDKLQKVADYFEVSIDYLVGTSVRDFFNKIVNEFRQKIAEILQKENISVSDLSSKLGIDSLVLIKSLEDSNKISYEDFKTMIENIISSSREENADEILMHYFFDFADLHSKIFKYEHLRPWDEPFESTESIYNNNSNKPIIDIFPGIGEIKLSNSNFAKSSSSLSLKEERDIARDLERMLSNLENQEAMSFYDGEPLDEESKELLRISLENSMRLAKQMAKKKFTPKKYRKEE